jgi:hypothetical protein
MARPSYGAEAKKRARCLLEVLLAYANDELSDRDEAALDALRPHIQMLWQADDRLVVRTKARFLAALTSLRANQQQLSTEQIKEALKRFADFLEILEDNRPTRSGSEIWHFTLKLWHKRHDLQANLQTFDWEWESRRPEKSKQVTRCEEDKEDKEDYWQQLCHTTLEAQNRRRLTTNPLTSADGVTFEFDEVYVPLELVERKQRDRRSEDVSVVEGSRLYEAEETEVSQSFAPEEFLEKVLQQGQSRRIAVVGEPGAGKTTLLQKIAAWVLENTPDLPIWVSLADLQSKTLEEYLIEDWLKAATRKRHVSQEIEESFCEQFNRGRVWLLLDAVDEMALESSQSLTKIASFLTSWVADARVILTCRLNVWDAGKNVLETFDTYRNLNFSYGDRRSPDRVGQFIQRWFRDNPALGESLRAELDQPGRMRIKDAVKNPLRLALLCRTWGLVRGLPNTKAMLYQQFVEAIYEWKQDRFPTTSSQRQQLNRSLGKLALAAIAQEKTKFRLRHGFVAQILDASDDGMFQLALQLGWLNQVGISDRQGEKVYAFYHPTFQEYFAALAIDDWRFFLNQNSSHLPIFNPEWREVILLWLGRDDLSQTQKEEFIRALIQFKDGCGSFYSYQAYFLAARGIAEFADCSLSNEIVGQLIKWRFGYFHPKLKKWWRFPPPIAEGARIALVRTDRAKAIAALEDFIQSTTQNDFEVWSAAYSLGKAFDPGNRIAIATLEKIVTSIHLENLRLQAADSLGKVDPGNQVAVSALLEIIELALKDSTRRKAAYNLGKIDPGNKIAIATLEKIIASTTSKTLQQQAQESLRVLQEGENGIRTYRQNNSRDRAQKASELHERGLAALIEGIASAKDEDSKRRRACRLAKADPGNLLAFTTLVELVKSASTELLRKRTADHFKKLLLDEQMPQSIASLKDCFSHEVTEEELERFRHCYKLLWHCSENMSYKEFYKAWHGLES